MQNTADAKSYILYASVSQPFLFEAPFLSFFNNLATPLVNTIQVLKLAAPLELSAAPWLKITALRHIDA